MFGSNTDKTQIDIEWNSQVANKETLKMYYRDCYSFWLIQAVDNEHFSVTPSTYSGQYRYVLCWGPALPTDSVGFLRWSTSVNSYMWN